MECGQSSFRHDALDQLKRHNLQLPESVRYLQELGFLLQLQRINNLSHFLQLVLVLVIKVLLQRQKVILEVGQP